MHDAQAIARFVIVFVNDKDIFKFTVICISPFAEGFAGLSSSMRAGEFRRPSPRVSLRCDRSSTRRTGRSVLPDRQLVGVGDQTVHVTEELQFRLRDALRDLQL